jgi:hypothetical protein
LDNEGGILLSFHLSLKGIESGSLGSKKVGGRPAKAQPSEASERPKL